MGDISVTGFVLTDFWVLLLCAALGMTLNKIVPWDLICKNNSKKYVNCVGIGVNVIMHGSDFLKTPKPDDTL